MGPSPVWDGFFTHPSAKGGISVQPLKSRPLSQDLLQRESLPNLRTSLTGFSLFGFQRSIRGILGKIAPLYPIIE